MVSSKRLNIAPLADKKFTLVLAGGGSGGHITPALVVAEELKKLVPHAQLVFIGQTGDKLKDIPNKHSSIDEVYTVRAGKFRRYHGEGIKQLFDIKTWMKNMRDFFYLIIGIRQSYKLLKKLDPAGIFIKGGYVGVPVGLASAMLKIPYVTHDSDAVPGLANRIISHWAKAHAVALPKNMYKYPSQKTFTVGVPISSKFQPVSDELRANYKKQLGLKPGAKVLFVTGGGMGAQRLNEAVAKASVKWLSSNPELVIIHATGPALESSTNELYDRQLKDAKQRLQVITKGFFVDDLFVNSGAADIVITRAGATNIAEFAAQHKACIIVPNPQLTGGHQLKNAKYLTNQKAAIIVNDKDLSLKPEQLITAVQELLDNPKKRSDLGEELGRFARPRAAKELAELLLENAK